MAAVAASLLSAELERYLTYVREDLHNHLLASIRGSALNARLRQLVNGAMGRIKQGLMQIRLLVPIRA